MGYVPPKPPPPPNRPRTMYTHGELMALHGSPAPKGPPPLNLDRFGMPRDYATYVWLLYGKRVEDKSPERRRFLDTSDFPAYMAGAYRARLFLPEPDLDLIGTSYR